MRTEAPGSGKRDEAPIKLERERERALDLHLTHGPYPNSRHNTDVTSILSVVLTVLGGVLLFVALTNAAAMLRPRRNHPEAAPLNFCILIPARNEAVNLKQLLPELLKTGVRVYVFDDESSDGTAAIATQAGAIVVRPSGPLPEGWTGKNRACHQLALAAAEDSPASWLFFLDADVRVKPGWAESIQAMIHSEGGRSPVLTGFPQFTPGRSLEPMFLAWMPWILLATNPFGLVGRIRLGHNGFTNGQCTMWRASTYSELWPHQEFAGAILEDVRIGAWLRKRKVRVSVFDLSSVLQVRMYGSPREALDGMSKNVFEIGRWPGTLALTVLFLAVGVGPLLLRSPIPAALFGASWGATLVISRMPIWVLLTYPVSCVVAAGVFLRSAYWHFAGKVQWKGRVYPGQKNPPRT